MRVYATLLIPVSQEDDLSLLLSRALVAMVMGMSTAIFSSAVAPLRFGTAKSESTPLTMLH